MEDKDLFSGGNWEDSKEERTILESDLYLKLEEGDTIVRLLGKYIFRNVHFVQEAKLQYNLCCGDGCPFCANGNTPRLTYYINALDRKDDKVRILAFGITLKRKFQNIISKYGDISGYDIAINRTGTKLDTRYDVLPLRESKPITDVIRKQILENFVNLEEKFIIHSAEELAKNTGQVKNADSIKSTTNITPPNAPQPPNSLSKECFGTKFNPLNELCKPCELGENCKTLTINFLTSPKSDKK